MDGSRHDRGSSGKRARTAAQPKNPDVQRLVHELEVHRVELEVQNEELRAARGDVETGLRRYTELFEVAPVGYLVVGADGGVRDLNVAAARLLGVERTAARDRPLSAFVASLDQVALARFLADALADEGPHADAACEVAIVRQPGPELRARLTATRLAGQRGAVLLSAADVTSQRRAERALREESDRKDELLSALSHELRNPLAPIRTGLGLLARAPPGSEQARRALRVVARQVAHLSQLLDDLLDATRIVRGRMRLQREPVELGELVRQTVEDHRVTFDGAGVALEARLPRDGCWVLADATRVVQILGNLLVNASKATAAGGRVEVTVVREPDAGAVTIRDTGVGIPAELQERLFQPFTQGQQPLERPRGGLGLGLATVKGLVELHGGSVALASGGPGRGAEFTVRFPLTAAPAARRGERAPGPCDERHRVLVIDDNEDAATTLREILELSGHDVRIAYDGVRGVALAHAYSPDTVICDIGLPGMDGYAVARALRTDPATRDAYLVALSGYAQPDDVRRAGEAGFDRHLAKPVAVDTLSRALAAPRPAHGAAAGPSPDGGRGAGPG